ncbi:NAD-P-binding protein [Mycena vitilis]|nr:NAD-P-binding protein [Mycena vitilis]KAJ6454756.1 NAD-P-binding protein [Mycena vitilis]
MSLPTFTSTTTAEEVTTTFANDIQGKNVLITGTSLNGIGFETARVLAKHANLVIVTGYNTERLKLTQEALEKGTPGANIRPLILDLSSFAAVRKAAAEVNAYSEPIHVLIHNAAAGGLKELTLTADGLDLQIGTAHFGPFLFTKLIAPKLLATSNANFTPRVVAVSSIAHGMGSGLDFNVLAKPDAAKYTNLTAYGAAKSANILFASELSKRSQGKINAYSLHPGAIVTNMTQKEQNRDDLIALGFLKPNGTPCSEKFQWKTIPQGAATTIVAAFDTRLQDKAGAYLVDGRVANEQVAPHSSNPENASKLWTISEEIVGERFTF